MAPGYTHVTPTTIYSPERGYGFDLASTMADDKPFYFSVSVPEGNYRVTAVLGDRPGRPTRR